MVIYKESATRIYAVNARIDRINYQNQLQDRRISACISYSINGKPRTEWVDFWNAEDKSKPQLCTSFKKTCKVGDILIALCKGSDRGFNSCVLKFAKEGNAIKIKDHYIYFGPIEQKETTNQYGTFSAVAVKTPTKNIAMRIAGWDRSLADMHLQDDENYIIVAHNPEEEITPDGRRIMRYNGDVMYRNNDIPVFKTLSGELVINIGCYANRPTLLCDLLNVETECEKKRVLSWMHYVADEWQPVNDPALVAQKNAVSQYLRSVESAMQASA